MLFVVCNSSSMATFIVRGMLEILEIYTRRLIQQVVVKLEVVCQKFCYLT